MKIYKGQLQRLGLDFNDVGAEVEDGVMKTAQKFDEAAPNVSSRIRQNTAIKDAIKDACVPDEAEITTGLDDTFAQMNGN